MGCGVCSVVLPVTGILVAGYCCVLYAFLAHGLQHKTITKIYREDKIKFFDKITVLYSVLDRKSVV